MEWEAVSMSLKSKVRHTVLGATAALLGACAAQPPPAPAHDAEAAQRRAFLVCDIESRMALNMARNYFLSGRKEDQVLPYVGNRQPGLGIAQRLFREAAAGTVSHHADFATEILFECASREKMSLDKPRGLVTTCFARVDIPFFLHTWRQQGLAKDAAIARVETMLKDRNVYSEPLIQSTAQTVYSADVHEDGRKVMGTVFWSCVYNTEWRQSS
jgi:hypothetical protein